MFKSVLDVNGEIGFMVLVEIIWKLEFGCDFIYDLSLDFIVFYVYIS